MARQDPSQDSDELRNCGTLVVICIHMAGCTCATRWRVAVVSGAARPLLGPFGLWLAAAPEASRRPIAPSGSAVPQFEISSEQKIFLPEVREFIKDTRPKTNTTRGGRKAHRPTPKTRTIHPPSSRTVSSGRVVGGRPQTPARLGVANPPGPISVSDPIRNTDGYPCRPSPQRRRAQGCHRTALRLAPAYAG